jgi:hypothetical protein
MATVRSVSWVRPRASEKAPKTNATEENAIVKPSTMKIGRARLAGPTDAARRVGSIGKMQGAAMVTVPARTARRISIMVSPRLVDG